MWSFAAFVSPQGAADLGKAYLVLRAMYPLIWLARGDFDPTIFSCTIPQYGIIIYMMASVFALSHFGLDLRGIFLGYHTLGAATFAAVFLGGFFGMCALTTAVKSAGFFPAPVADKKKA